MRRPPLAQVLTLGCLLAVVVAALVARRTLGLEWTPESVREVVSRFQPWAPSLFIGIVGLRPFLLIPSQVLLVGGGICFGSLAGTLYGAAGMLLSGTLAFVLARRLGQAPLRARLPAQLLPALEAAGSGWGAAFIALGTAYPLGPVTAYHAAAGVTRMPLGRFYLALVPGALARAALFTLFGATLAEGSVHGILAAGAGLLLVVALPLTHAGLRRRLWQVLGQ